jgi:uncharacterized membrane protein
MLVTSTSTIVAISIGVIVCAVLLLGMWLARSASVVSATRTRSLCRWPSVWPLLTTAVASVVGHREAVRKFE